MAPVPRTTLGGTWQVQQPAMYRLLCLCSTCKAFAQVTIPIISNARYMRNGTFQDGAMLPKCFGPYSQPHEGMIVDIVHVSME
jgi:hypothetical protein